MDILMELVEIEYENFGDYIKIMNGIVAQIQISNPNKLEYKDAAKLAIELMKLDTFRYVNNGEFSELQRPAPIEIGEYIAELKSSLDELCEELKEINLSIKGVSNLM